MDFSTQFILKKVQDEVNLRRSKKPGQDEDICVSVAEVLKEVLQRHYDAQNDLSPLDLKRINEIRHFNMLDLHSPSLWEVVAEIVTAHNQGENKPQSSPDWGSGSTRDTLSASGWSS